MKSKLFTLNWKDVIKALVVFFLTSLISGLYALSQSGDLLNIEALKTILIASATATMGYLLKNFLSNSNDEVFKKELPSVKY